MVTAEVRNQGAVAAGVSITKFDLVSTTGGATKNLKGVQNIPALAARGQRAARRVTLAIYSDTLRGHICCGRARTASPPRSAESSTANNCLLSSGTITVFDVPDLEVTGDQQPAVVRCRRGSPSWRPIPCRTRGGRRAAVPPGQVLPGVRHDPDRPEDRRSRDGGTARPWCAPFTHTLALTVRPETVPGTYAPAGRAPIPARR